MHTQKNEENYTKQNLHLKIEVRCKIKQQASSNCPRNAPWIAFWIFGFDCWYFNAKQNENSEFIYIYFHFIYVYAIENIEKKIAFYQMSSMSVILKMLFPMDERWSMIFNSANSFLSWRTISIKLCDIISLFLFFFNQNFLGISSGKFYKYQNTTLIYNTIQ